MHRQKNITARLFSIQSLAGIAWTSGKINKRDKMGIGVHSGKQAKSEATGLDFREKREYILRGLLMLLINLNENGYYLDRSK